MLIYISCCRLGCTPLTHPIYTLSVTDMAVTDGHGENGLHYRPTSRLETPAEPERDHPVGHIYHCLKQLLIPALILSVVAPKSIITQWEKEIKTCTPDLRVYIYTGTGRTYGE